MIFEHYLLLILAILPFFYKYSFWFYTIQLKEYRWDRFREYLSTKQAKTAIINIWSVIELPLLILSFFIFFNKSFEIIIFNVVFVFLLMQNIFVFRKIIKASFLKPKITSRLFLTTFILILFLILDLSFIIYYEFSSIIYSYILFLYLFAPIIIFISIILTLPLVNYLKNKKINKAIKISQKLNFPIKIWITWSYWKSSVKEFLSSILEQDWKTLKTPENINTELWVSSIIINKLKNTYKYFVAEMWAYKIWEIDLLWRIVNHKYWFLTAIWTQHLALFWSQENIIIWKSEIKNSVLKNDWILYINWENENIRKINFEKNLNIVKYWNHSWSQVKYNIIQTKEKETEFELEYKNSKNIFKTNLLWKHNILNLSWVLAFCIDIWIEVKDLQKYIKNIKNPDNTLNTIKNKDFVLIDDSYNLSKDWLLAWIEVFDNYDSREKILILDDILELWKDSVKIHYELAKNIAKKDINYILYCWINYKEAFEKWLIDWWFKSEQIINSTENIKKWSIILFEWRNTLKYINNFK